MAAPSIQYETVAKVLKQWELLRGQGLNVTQAAKKLGMRRSTLSAYINEHAASVGYEGDISTPPRSPSIELDIDEAPDAAEPISELLARRKKAYDRKSAADAWSNLIDVRVKIPGPVAICAVGDPHVDDDLCDIEAIEHDMTIIGKTPGMYALHVGDITNNWVGRLGRLYAHQTTKASDAIRLSEWMFNLAPPLAVVAGNHDLWNEGMSWLNFAVKQSGTKILAEHGVRLNLVFPNGDPVRVHTRHDFPGHSQFNPLHGLRKEHLFGFRDHINIAGHKHIDSCAVVPSPDGYMQWMLRVSGYKAHDDYAKSLNLVKMKMAPTCALIIDPSTSNPAELVKPFWCLEEAADFLTFKRKRK